MIIKQTPEAIVVTLPANVQLNIEEVERFLRYLRYKELVASSMATQEDIDQLAREINKSWWAKNKNRFLPEQ
ncbi:MAG: hypothetical protein J0L99_04595 [Chitinophagales bacterium]|nr:hypothetical protein [Chitinophagales bacterium]